MISHQYISSDSSTVVDKSPAKASTATGADVATRVAWVDASRMTRDCLTHSVAEAQQTFMLIPFASMRDCITYTSCEFDLIVYHSHDDDDVNLSDAIALREVFSSTPILVLSDASMLDHAVVRDVLDMGASGLVPTRRTSLRTLVATIGLLASGGTVVPREFLLDERQQRPAEGARKWLRKADR